MTEEQIIALWEKDGPALNDYGIEFVPRFARLIQAEQREADARLADEYGTPGYASDLAAAIRNHA